MDQSTSILLMRLWRHINLRRRRQFSWLLILMLLASVAEVLSIGAVLPFLGVITAPERIFEMPIAQPLITFFELTSANQLLVPVTILFGVASFFAGAIRLLLLWFGNQLSFATGADLSLDIYRRTLYQAYEVHCSRNSSEIITGISSKVNGVIFGIIMPTLTFVSSCIIILVIMSALMMVEPGITLLVFGGFGLIYYVISLSTKKQLLIDSNSMARESTRVVRYLQEGLGGIRDVLIDGNQEAYCKLYQSADVLWRRAQANTLFIGASPRYYMEVLGIILLTVLAYYLSLQDDGIAKAIPVLGALALGAQRLLPLMQQAYASWIQINAGNATLRDALELLDQSLPDYIYQPTTLYLPFKKSISLNQVSFRYNLKTPYIFKDISFTINKGSRIGFVGVTGSGKSTLLDIIMGLLQPTEGALEIDGQIVNRKNQRLWQAHIAHVPQVIFLADSTIEENIAFGIPRNKIDHARVVKAAQQAQISDSIDAFPLGYQTFVGERGIRLSGGQRQRIGIARALYKQADVIIFDEATSALDGETEQALIQAIEYLSKDLTLLIIAHRLSTLQHCSQIVELNEGGIKRVCSYKEFNDVLSK